MALMLMNNVLMVYKKYHLTVQNIINQYNVNQNKIRFRNKQYFCQI